MRIALKRAGVALAGALLATSVATSPAYAEPAALTGTITSDATGEPLPGCVNVYTTEYSWAGGTCTDTGDWTLEGLETATGYKVEVMPSVAGFALEWAHDAPDFESATTITAPSTVDVALPPLTTMRGTLAMADGDPVPEGTLVQVWQSGGDLTSVTMAAGDGTWETTIRPGRFKVEFVAQGAHRWAFGKATSAEAAEITATLGETVTVDDTLPAIDETSFSGTLRAADTGAPVIGCVFAYTADTHEQVAATCTGDDGAWAIGSLAAGAEFKFEANTWDNVHLGEWSDGATDFDSAAAHAGPAIIDFSLDVGATISGSVLGADLQQVENAHASLESASGEVVDSFSVFPDGTFSELVRPGDYTVQIDSGEGQVWAPSARTRDAATVYSFRAGETTTVDVRYPARASVRGVVRSDVDGAPLQGICVEVRPADPDAIGGGYGCTDSDGSYEVRLGEPGTFIAHFVDSAASEEAGEDPATGGNWVAEYNGDAASADTATAFTVEAGQPAVVNASLAPAAVISGVALDAKLGTPVAGACATAFLGHGGSRSSDQFPVCSGSDGRWSVKGLPAGSYALNLNFGNEPGAVSDTWAFRSTTQAGADLVTVATGEHRAIRGVKLPSPALISGRITDVSGNPVEGATINPRGNLIDRSGECFNCAVTDADGRYTLPPLPAGSYRPVAYAPWDNPLAPVWSGGSSSYDAATAITLKPGKAAEFSASMLPASRITGRLVSASGQGLDGWIGEVVTLTGRHVADMDAYPTDEFTVRNLPAGTYRVRFEHWETGQVVWLGGASTPEASTPVTLGVGETKDVTFHLP